MATKLKGRFGSEASGIVGIFDDEHLLLDAAKKTYAAGYRKFDTISPFPIHGMDDAMGLKRSPIPYVTFTFGVIGFLSALLLQWYTAAFDWPVNVGGKPAFSLPAFIPVTFELTVLFAGLATFASVLFFCRLPKIDPPILDPDLTSHRFGLFIPNDDVGFEATRAESHLKTVGAVEVKKVAEF